MFGFSNPLTFTVNFPTHLLETAKSFRQQQQSPQKAEQVYLNTLAVYAVKFYCECMGIEAELSQGDSWNPAMQTLLDTADLVLPEGTIECRPILPEEQSCNVPLEAQENRKGYVVVEVDTKAREAKLIGFAKTVKTGTLQRSELQSLESLIDEIIEVEPAISSSQLAAQTLEQVSARLSNWLNEKFEELWKPSGLVLAPSRSISSRSLSAGAGTPKERAKLLTVGTHTVALMVQVKSADRETLSVFLRVLPEGERTLLPTGLILELLDDESDVAMSTTAGATDNFRELSFEIETEEMFSVRITVDDVSETEQFIS